MNSSRSPLQLYVNFPKGVYNLRNKDRKNPELSEDVSTTQLEES